MKCQLSLRSWLGRSLVMLGCSVGWVGWATVATFAQEATASSSSAPSADAKDVAAAQARLKELGSNAKVTVADGKLTEIVKMVRRSPLMMWLCSAS
jgi:hypothetical protein